MRKIGGVDVSAIGLGTMSMGGHAYGPERPLEERLALLDKAYELGCTFWDWCGRSPFLESRRTLTCS
jgi:aryl-alcohol dehydrogenase-like predicted oxidoreductase